MENQEEKKEHPSFQLKGKINYEMMLSHDNFQFRTQVSNENNLAAMLQCKDILGHLITAKSNPAIAKKDRISNKEMHDIKTTFRMLEKYSTQLAGAIYDLTVKEHEKPKLSVVTEGEIVAEELKKKGIV